MAVQPSPGGCMLKSDFGLLGKDVSRLAGGILQSTTGMAKSMHDETPPVAHVVVACAGSRGAHHRSMDDPVAVSIVACGETSD